MCINYSRFRDSCIYKYIDSMNFMLFFSLYVIIVLRFLQLSFIVFKKTLFFLLLRKRQNEISKSRMVDKRKEWNKPFSDRRSTKPITHASQESQGRIRVSRTTYSNRGRYSPAISLYRYPFSLFLSLFLSVPDSMLYDAHST